LAITGVSKLAGFAREVLISQAYGVSPTTDVFFGLQQLLVLLSSYLLGAFALAFIPHFAKARTRGTEAALIRRSSMVLLGVGVALTVLFLAGSAGPVLAIVGLQRHGDGVGPLFARTLAVAILPTICVGLAHAALHGEGRHIQALTLAALTPWAMLISFMVFTFAPGPPPAIALPWSFSIGALVAGTWGAIVLRRMATSRSHQQPLADSRAGGLRRDLIAATAENVGFGLNQYFTVMFASLTGPGSVSVNAYALRIAFLPLSGIVGPLNQILQSRLAAIEGDARWSWYRPLLLRAGAILATSSAVLFFFRTELVSLVYQRGAFSPSATAAVAAALTPYAAYLFVMALNQTLARYYFVSGRSTEYAVAMTVAYSLGNVAKALTWQSFGLLGVIWASVGAEALALIVLMARISRASPPTQ
jgi:putative peptidoglycan lipid II flippase